MPGELLNFIKDSFKNEKREKHLKDHPFATFDGDTLISNNEDNLTDIQKVEAKYAAIPHTFASNDISQNMNKLFDDILKYLPKEEKDELLTKEHLDFFADRTIYTMLNQRARKLTGLELNAKDYMSSLDNKADAKINHDNWMAAVANKNPKSKDLLKNSSFLDVAIYTFIKSDKYRDDLVKKLIEKLPDEKQNELLQKYGAVKKLEDIPDDEILFQPYKDKIEELKQKDLTNVQKEALEYFDKNMRVTNSDYDNALFARESERQGLIEKRANTLLAPIKNEKGDIAEIIDPVVIVKDLNKYEEYKNYELDIPKESKEAMKVIMHKLDELDAINDSNMYVAEEGTKIYSCANVSKAFYGAQHCIENNDLENLPKYVEAHKQAIQKMDEIYDLAKANFSQDGKTYGGNVDVSRTSTLPLKYRKDSQTTSLINDLFIALKDCKANNVSIDEFCDNPHAAFNKICQNAMEKSDISAWAKGKSVGSILGTLTKKDSPERNMLNGTNGLNLRGFDSINGYTKDESKLAHNSFVRNIVALQTNNIFARQYVIYDKFFENNTKETIKNMFLAQQEDKDLMELCANEKVNQFDLTKFKPVDHVKAKENLDNFVKTHNYDYSKLSSDILTSIKDFTKGHAELGSSFKDLIDGSKEALEEIKKQKELSPTSEEGKILQSTIDKLNDKEFLKGVVNEVIIDEKNKAKESLEKSLGIKIDDKKVSQRNKELIAMADGNSKLTSSCIATAGVFNKSFKNFASVALFNNASNLEGFDMYKTINDYDNYTYNLENINESNKYIDKFSNASEVISLQSTGKTWKNTVDDIYKSFPKNNKELIENGLDVMLQGSNQRIQDRGNAAKKFIANALNSQDRNKKLELSCSMLKVLEDKHESRKFIWKLFNFRQNKKEKNFIAEIKASIKEQGFSDQEIEEGKKALSKPIDVTNLKTEHSNKHFSRLAKAFSKEDKPKVNFKPEDNLDPTKQKDNLSKAVDKNKDLNNLEKNKVEIQPMKKND